MKHKHCSVIILHPPPHGKSANDKLQIGRFLALLIAFNIELSGTYNHFFSIRRNQSNTQKYALRHHKHTKLTIGTALSLSDEK